MRTPSERLAQGLPASLPKDRKARGEVLRAAKAAKKKLTKTVVLTDAEVAPESKDTKELRKIAAPFDTEGDLVDIWERRMLNPQTEQSHPIRVKTPGMHLRWINLSTTGRYQRARYSEGWAPVLKQELIDEREIFGVSYTIEGYVCRGEKQTEMLMKIPEAVWKKIRSRKYEAVRKSNEQIRDSLQQSAARDLGNRHGSARGEQIADTLGTFKGNIKFGTEQVEPEASDLEPSFETEGAQS